MIAALNSMKMWGCAGCLMSSCSMGLLSCILVGSAVGGLMCLFSWVCCVV